MPLPVAFTANWNLIEQKIKLCFVKGIGVLELTQLLVCVSLTKTETGTLHAMLS